ncbi:hypothetical protein [Hymenobacter terricola]|uniref:hypothetical protein n=1 Tax=Hymenobacter terricola TaxID=2819236 RepID=UPI001B309492|nr:hypothetical protein [Hymenobacter terricola]
MEEFHQYQSFANAEVAQGLLSLFRHHNIVYETGLDEPAYSLNMAFNPTDTRFVVRLRPDDFETARRLEDEFNHHFTATADPNHYLYTFTNDELFDMLVKPDEWNSYDVTLAGQILRQRGRSVTPDTVRLLQQNRLVEMAKPEPSQKSWILAGYVFALLGGFISIFIGWHLRNHTKLLPNGAQVPAFSADDRAHGLRILVLGCLGAVASIALRVSLSK